ncbi:PTS sugar transporter subunit IIC [Lactobacillus sp. CBA3606]|uniref:PTS transporter subunit EIIC n=1 Tax=Lactobacillus sp. CBA3606 TaxID=2099789 RepID=UPI000CFE320D|nr:PTS transporter subunit EIIC [Lactobacillus sp. CBA3606]AVK62699.1 PTS sugar transporter subunit IIC [Lactobacillus sp. CBA3606]
MMYRMGQQLLKMEAWLNRRRYFQAIQATLQLLFPVVLLGAYVDSVNQAVFQKNGFLNQIYAISQWLPGFSHFARYTTLLSASLNGLIAVAAAFAVANFVVRSAQRDYLLAGLTATLSFMMLNFNFGIATKTDQAAGTSFLTTNLGMRGFLLALLVGLITGALFNKLTAPSQSIFNERQWLARVKMNWLPLVLTLGGFSLLSYGSSLVNKTGVNGLFYLVSQWPFVNPGTVLGAILGVTFLSNSYWLLGLVGPLDFSGDSSVSTIQNLEYALQHGSAWGAPNPVTVQTIFDSFANVGGPGMTLALIIAILWQSRHRRYRQVAKVSWLPSLFNFNQPLLFGLPLILRPILAIPFLVAPLVTTLITWTALKLQWMPPVVYPLHRTTPGFLMGWLGTGGDWHALLVSGVNLVVATAIYLPFIWLDNQAVKGGASR